MSLLDENLVLLMTDFFILYTEYNSNVTKKKERFWKLFTCENKNLKGNA